MPRAQIEYERGLLSNVAQKEQQMAQKEIQAKMNQREYMTHLRHDNEALVRCLVSLHFYSSRILVRFYLCNLHLHFFCTCVQEQRKRDERERERVESAKLMETYTRMLDEQERKRQEFINSVSRKQDAMTVRYLCLTTVCTCCIAARATGIRCDRNDSSLLCIGSEPAQDFHSNSDWKKAAIQREKERELQLLKAMEVT